MAPAQETATRQDGPAFAETPTFPSLAISHHSQQATPETREAVRRVNKMLSDCEEVVAVLEHSPDLILPHIEGLKESLAQMGELFDEIETETEISGSTSAPSDAGAVSEVRMVEGAEKTMSDLMARLNALSEVAVKHETDKACATFAYEPKLDDEARAFLKEKGEFWNEPWATLCRTEDGAHAIRCISVRGKDQEQYNSVFGLSWEFAFDPRLNGDFQQEWHSPHAEPGGRWREVPDYSEYEEAKRVLEETGEQIEFTLPIPFLEPEDPIEPAKFESVDPGKKNIRALMLAGKYKTLEKVLKTSICKEKHEPETYELYCNAMNDLE